MLKNWLNSLGILRKKTKPTWIADILQPSDPPFSSLEEYIQLYKNKNSILSKQMPSISLETRLYYLCKLPKSIDDSERWLELLLAYELHLSDAFLTDLIELSVGKYAYDPKLTESYQKDLEQYGASIHLNEFKQIQRISTQHLIRYLKDNGWVPRFFAPLIEKIDRLGEESYALLCQYMESKYDQYPFPQNLPPIEFYDEETGNHIDEARFVKAVWSSFVYLHLHAMLPEEEQEEKIPPQYESFLYTCFQGQGTFKNLDLKTRWQAGYLYKKYALEPKSQEHSTIQKQLEELESKF